MKPVWDNDVDVQNRTAFMIAGDSKSLIGRTAQESIARINDQRIHVVTFQLVPAI